MSEHIANALQGVDKAAFNRTRAAENALANQGLFLKYATEIEAVPLTATGEPALLSHTQLNHIRDSLKKTPYGRYVEDMVAEGKRSMVPGLGFNQIELVAADHKGGIERFRPSSTALATRDLKGHLISICEDEGLGRLSFEPHPHPPSTKLTSGYHTNLSLLDEAGNNLFAGVQGKHLRRHCVDEMLKTQAEGALLMLPTPSSFDRIAHTNMGPKRVLHTVGKGNFLLGHNWWPTTFESGSVAERIYLGKAAKVLDLVPHHPVYFPTRYLVRSITQSDPAANRIENRLPGANANELLVAATDSAAVEQAITKNVKRTPTGLLEVVPHSGKFHTFSLPKTLEEAVHTFEHSGHMKNLLGDALHAEIAASYKGGLAVVGKAASNVIRRL